MVFRHSRFDGVYFICTRIEGGKEPSIIVVHLNPGRAWSGLPASSIMWYIVGVCGSVFCLYRNILSCQVLGHDWVQIDIGSSVGFGEWQSETRIVCCASAECVCLCVCVFTRRTIPKRVIDIVWLESAKLVVGGKAIHMKYGYCSPLLPHSLYSLFVLQRSVGLCLLKTKYFIWKRTV